MPPSEPEVSVLIPCFNKASYVEETLQSVYAQRLGAADPAAAIEVIVVDDGSTDGSAALLERHRDRCTIVLGPNRGASAARQRALELSRGRFVQYLDANDLLEPDALARSVLALEQSGADVAYGNWQRYTPPPASAAAAGARFERGAIVSTRIEDVDADPEIACFTRFWSPPAALLYRRTLIERMPRWHDALPVIQDARYLQEAAFAGARFVHVDALVALYRDDASNSLSKRSQLNFVRDMYRNGLEIEALWRARGELTGAQRDALAECFGASARIIFREDDALFDACCERLRAIGRDGVLAWPRIARTLRATVGKRAALKTLAVLNRPAG